ncbi:MAG: SpoIIE family protein phosphatase [Acidobacteriota bacterium]|nr:SpoIIE family protein phosphatase [Acidobacteriota bacterium]
MTNPDAQKLETTLESAEALLESAQLLHSSLDLDQLLRHLLRSVMGRLLVSKSLIAVADDSAMRLALVRGTAKIAKGQEYDEAAARAAGIEIILPIGDEAAPVGLLGLSNPPNRQISDGEMEFLSALLGIASSGISNARAHTEAQQLNQQLDQKVQELRALLDLVRGLTATIEPDEVAQLLMLTLAGRWAVRRYALIAWKTGHPPVMRMKGMELDALADYESYGIDVEALAEAIKVADLPECPLKNILREAQGEVLFPIRAGDATTGGFALLGARPGNLSYSESDMEFGAGLTAQAAVAFENAWFVRETLERKKMEQELALAATIQQNLFPAELPKLEGFDLAARNRPARSCGGDYYDALPFTASAGNCCHLICVADVSGKGLPASLLMSNMQATMRALLGRIPSLTELATHTNTLLYATTPSNKYVTAILVELDPATGKGRYVSAGHQDCLLLRANGEAEWLTSTGTPLGLMEPSIIELISPYEERYFEMQPGDLIALFSDGVTEAQDEQENEYGEARVADFLRPIAQELATGIVEKVFTEIDRFAGSAPQYDDITLFVIKREA